MTHFLLIPGGGGAGYVWHRVVTELTARGHVAIAVDLPAEDAAAGPEQYADHAAARATEATEATGLPGAEQRWTVVGMSLGAFTAPLLATRIRVAEIVLVNPMIPRPGESAGDWWSATGHGEAMREAARAGGYSGEFDLEMFFHDLGAAEQEALTAHERDESGSFDDAFGLAAWPEVPTRVIASTADRMFPATFVARLAQERLDVATTFVPGGHLSPLSQPAAMTSALLGDGEAGE